MDVIINFRTGYYIDARLIVDPKVLYLPLMLSIIDIHVFYWEK
jgi:hypothetical protein